MMVVPLGSSLSKLVLSSLSWLAELSLLLELTITLNACALDAAARCATVRAGPVALSETAVGRVSISPLIMRGRSLKRGGSEAARKGARRFECTCV